MDPSFVCVCFVCLPDTSQTRYGADWLSFIYANLTRSSFPHGAEVSEIIEVKGSNIIFIRSQCHAAEMSHPTKLCDVLCLEGPSQQNHTFDCENVNVSDQDQYHLNLST